MCDSAYPHPLNKKALRRLRQRDLFDFFRRVQGVSATGIHVLLAQHAGGEL
jgi:hypothetical protein